MNRDTWAVERSRPLAGTREERSRIQDLWRQANGYDENTELAASHAQWSFYVALLREGK